MRGFLRDLYLRRSSSSACICGQSLNFYFSLGGVTGERIVGSVCRAQAAARVFPDSNIVIYAYSGTDLAKQRMAREAILAYDCFVSSQTLNEFCNICIKKLNMSIDEIWIDIMDLLLKCEFRAVQQDTVEKALELHEKHQFSFHDGLIAASTIECQCGLLFSEDMRNGQVIQGVTITNPFLRGQGRRRPQSRLRPL